MKLVFCNQCKNAVLSSSNILLFCFQSRGLDLVESLSFLFQLGFSSLGKVRRVLGKVRRVLGKVRRVLGKVRRVLGKVRRVLGKVRRVLGKVRRVLGKVRRVLICRTFMCVMRTNFSILDVGIISKIVNRNVVTKCINCLW